MTIERTSLCSINTQRLDDIRETSIQIDGCACAVIACEHGQLVYDYELLIIHFRDHMGMQDDEDPDCPLMAIEWIEYNIIRSIPYYRGKGISPDIRHDGESILYSSSSSNS